MLREVEKSSVWLAATCVLSLGARSLRRTPRPASLPDAIPAPRFGLRIRSVAPRRCINDRDAARLPCHVTIKSRMTNLLLEPWAILRSCACMSSKFFSMRHLVERALFRRYSVRGIDKNFIARCGARALDALCARIKRSRCSSSRTFGNPNACRPPPHRSMDSASLRSKVVAPKTSRG
jgi:hypothetical protein